MSTLTRNGDRRQVLGWLTEIAGQAGDGAVVLDQAQRVLAWNKAAEAILGLSSGDVVGQRCHEVFCGRDESGNRVCCPRCPLFVMVQQGERVAPRDMLVAPHGGEPRWVNVSTLSAPGGVGVLHLFRDVSAARARERLAEAILAGRVRPPESTATPLATLTRRELEVLQLLTSGADTKEIAGALFISRLTARNHVQHILRKLGAASRAEAVAIALRGAAPGS